MIPRMSAVRMRVAQSDWWASRSVVSVMRRGICGPRSFGSLIPDFLGFFVGMVLPPANGLWVACAAHGGELVVASGHELARLNADEFLECLRQHIADGLHGGRVVTL